VSLAENILNTAATIAEVILQKEVFAMFLLSCTSRARILKHPV